jgi:hypothetical protein
MSWSPAVATNWLLFGDSLSTVGIRNRLRTLRPLDTWNVVSVSALMLTTTGGSPTGGAIGPGSDSFADRVHDVYYNGAMRNGVVNLSMAHGDVQDTSATALAVYDLMRTLVSAQRALDWVTCVCGIPATTEYNNPSNSPYKRPQRITYNAALRDGATGGRPVKAGADYFVDTELIAGLGQLDVPTDPPPGGTMLDAGGIHFASAGEIAMANLIHVVLG